MNYTRSQLHERISDLSGQYRAAQENKRLTSEKRAEQERLSDLARQADEKADAQLAAVIAELREANGQYAAAVEEIIGIEAPVGRYETVLIVPQEPLAVLPDATLESSIEPETLAGVWQGSGAQPCNSVFTEPADFQAQALRTAAERITDAFNEATR